jgi:hypothetical protein
LREHHIARLESPFGEALTESFSIFVGKALKQGDLGQEVRRSHG